MENTMNNKKENNNLGGIDMYNALKDSNIPSSILNGYKKAVSLVEKGTDDESVREFIEAVNRFDIKNTTSIIDDRAILKGLIKCLKGKSSISMLSIKMNSKNGRKCGALDLITSPQGRSTRYVGLEKEAVVPVGKAGYTRVKETDFAPFTHDVISMRFCNSDELKAANDYGIKVMWAYRDVTAYAYNKALGLWFNIEDGTNYTEEELDNIAIEKGAWIRVYKCFNYSASEIRSRCFTSIDCTYRDIRDEYLDIISNGSWSIAKDIINEMSCKISEIKSRSEAMQKLSKLQTKIQKTCPRFGQLKAGSVDMGQITSWAYVPVPFETCGGETLDGTGYIRASIFAKWCLDILGMEVKESVVSGMFVQARPDLQKGAYLILNDEVFDIVLEGIGYDYDIQYRGSCKDTEKPMMIVDKNVLKLESNSDEHDIHMELLEISGRSNSKLSTQILIKLLYKDLEKGQEYAFSKGIDFINKKFKAIFDREVTIPTPGDCSNNYLSGLVNKICPDMITKDPAMFKSELQTNITSCVNAINKMGFDMNGINCHLISDYSELIFGKGRENAVVRYGEIWMPDAEKYFRRIYRKEAIEALESSIDYPKMTKEDKMRFVSRYIDYSVCDTNIFMIKYPSMGVEEHYLPKLLSRKEVRRRIMNIKGNSNRPAEFIERAKKALIKSFLEQDDAVSMLPALQMTMFQMAGLDFDFDGAAYSYEQELVKILKKTNKIKAVLIDA